MRVHPVHVGAVHDTSEMEADGTESGIVGVGKVVDNGVEGVAADSIVIMF